MNQRIHGLCIQRAVEDKARNWSFLWFHLLLGGKGGKYRSMITKMTLVEGEGVTVSRGLRVKLYQKPGRKGNINTVQARARCIDGIVSGVQCASDVDELVQKGLENVEERSGVRWILFTQTGRVWSCKGMSTLARRQEIEITRNNEYERGGVLLRHPNVRTELFPKASDIRRLKVMIVNIPMDY